MQCKHNKNLLLLGGLDLGGDDSRFADPLALSKSLNALQQTASKKVAGHFALNFRRSAAEPSVGYYYYEWKARLGRAETIHGDQGFLLSCALFTQLGGFREDLPVQFEEMPKEEAEKTGALYFFKGKYPARVKVYYIGKSLETAWNKEFCGGPHVSRTGEIGKFKIMKEEASSAGVRRIRATVI